MPDESHPAGTAVMPERYTHPLPRRESGADSSGYVLFCPMQDCSESPGQGDNCSACEELEELLCQYATKAKNKKSYMPIFALNSSNTRVNKGLIATGGDNSYSDFKNTSNYLDIQISTTPALIIVKDGKVSDYISTKVTKTPKTDIKEYMNNLMK